MEVFLSWTLNLSRLYCWINNMDIPYQREYVSTNDNRKLINKNERKGGRKEENKLKLFLMEIYLCIENEVRWKRG